MNKPIDFDELYPGRFIKAGTLQGRKVTLTIAGVELQKLKGDNGEQVKGIVSFAGKDMQFVLNKTNGICIRAMFGRAVQEWVGKRVTLFPGEWNGEPCLRVWGSPDIDEDMTATIQLPQRKPQQMTMHKVSEENK